jgi:uncharacterized SAM-binding protein YcdF (DUF218 family)
MFPRLAIAVCIAYLAGFFVFLADLPVSSGGAVRGDGIVALTGSEERVDAAVALLEGGVGKRLLISGVHPFITKEQLKRIAHGGQRFDCCVDLGFMASNTHENALEATDWSRMHGYKSLVVVTANYHMPRSLVEFSADMPGVVLVPYPVEPDNINFRRWWRDPHSFRVLQGEYIKYLGSLVLTALPAAFEHLGFHHEGAGGNVRPAY